MECGEREFQCFCYGFSPLPVPDAHCWIALLVFYITFPLYFCTIIVGLNHNFKGVSVAEHQAEGWVQTQSQASDYLFN